MKFAIANDEMGHPELRPYGVLRVGTCVCTCRSSLTNISGSDSFSSGLPTAIWTSAIHSLSDHYLPSSAHSSSMRYPIPAQEAVSPLHLRVCMGGGDYLLLGDSQAHLSLENVYNVRVDESHIYRNSFLPQLLRTWWFYSNGGWVRRTATARLVVGSPSSLEVEVALRPSGQLRSNLAVDAVCSVARRRSRETDMVEFPSSGLSMTAWTNIGDKDSPMKRLLSEASC
ncbi:hypothetical protein EVAR_58460_1 [Eumeta japonica]|uniref:Uncharacterized protein n=1 Tax=Eumeta variegata TaxID=151549 RepID=A0A4C1Z6R6_EUMVA|nr:hypothetical protein EVAR_58460_1 [Eumeta japonica]